MLARMTITLAATVFAQAAEAEGFYLAGRVGVSTVDDAVSASTTTFSGPGLPSEIGLNGRPFDSSDAAFGLVIGWEVKPWVALELSYADLGEAESSLGGNFGAVPLIRPDYAPTIPINLPPSAIFSPVVVTPVPADANKATLSVTEWSLAARFRANVVSRLSANWSIGISHNEFDADGVLMVLQPIDPAPPAPVPVFEFVDIPYASPSSETGFNWGLGFEWAFNDRFAADLGYRQHKTGVLDVETVTLQIKLSL